MPRDIDHLVVAVHDLDQARANWQALGFTVAPTARHPFGTANAVVQLDGNYLELLAIADPEAIPEAGAGDFSFAGFNRDFLAKREGLSMLALKSNDADADRADFAAHGLPLFAPFDFERMATGPDGIEREVGFSLAFTREPRLRQVGFFTCQHRHPDNFWRAEYRRHRNGARHIASVVVATRDPADFHAFISHFSGQHDMIATSLGVIFDVGKSTIEILSPVGYAAWFGALGEPDPRRLLAARIAVADIGETGRALDEVGVPYQERMGCLIVSPDKANGVAIAFVDDTTWPP
jgi:hypothetical protein